MSRALLLLAPLALMGCGSIGAFDTPLSLNGTLPGMLSMTPGLDQSQIDASGSLQQTFSDKGVSVAHLKSAKLTAGSLTVTAPAGGDLSYFKSFEIYVVAKDQPSTRLAVVNAADLMGKPASVKFQLDDVELKPFIAAGSMTLSPQATLNSHPMRDENINVSLTVHVEPQL